jgi:perosamine synthetase
VITPMKIGRTLPPTAAPLDWKDLSRGLVAMLSPARSARVLEDEIRHYFGARHVFLVSSGTAALTLTLKALALRSPRNRVVIPAYTCFSVPAAVLAAGLEPALCDIDASTFDFDHDRLERALDDQTVCVVATHLFGIACDIERIRAICHPRGIAVVEDAAQAMGVESNGRKLGTLGDAGVFSLGRGKTITCGSGGVIVTSSDAIADAIRREWHVLDEPSLFEVAKDFVRVVVMAAFIRPRLYWIPAALPFLGLGETVFPRRVPLERMSGMKAGLLHDWPRRLRRSNRIRSANASDLIRRLALGCSHGPRHSYLRLPVLMATAEERERVWRLARKRGLGLGAGYPTAINEIPELRAVFNGQRFPSARRVAETLLTLPTHQWLSEKDKAAIADCIATVLARGNRSTSSYARDVDVRHVASGA